MDLTGQIIILVFLLFLSGFFSASEIALVSLSESKIRQLVAQKKWGSSYIRKLKDSPQRMLSTILIGNNIANTATAALTTGIMFELVGEHAVSIATGIVTLMILVFGEITPKTMAAQYNVPFSLIASPILWGLSIFFTPVLAVLDWMLKTIFRIFGFNPKEQTVTKDEIRHIVAAAEEEGSINESERHMVHNIFRFEELTAGEILTPRTDMIMLPSTATVDDALELIAQKQRSRIPIFEETRDHIVGVVYVKDLVGYSGKNRSITKVMKKPFFVPETKRINELLKRFQKTKRHLAIVVDEHGAVAGLLTLEDVLEEIVGEIADETERIDVNIKKKNSTLWVAKGKTTISEINSTLGTRLDNAQYDTISGFILSKLGRIPAEGDYVTYSKWRFTVKRIKGNRIVTIHAKKLR